MKRTQPASMIAIAAMTLAICTVANGFGQSGERHGSVERIKIHGKLLEGNLEGDSPDRDVSIYLPPSYKTELHRRYPVIYFLHGWGATDTQWFSDPQSYINVPSVMDKALASGHSKEMIVVTPNAFTAYGGSNYSNSATTGDWEDFIAFELVAFIDSHYRTIPNSASRGLAGHSMGGYGTLRIGMKHPEIFSSIYMLSGCCLAPGNNLPQTPEARAKVEAIKNLDDFNKAEFGIKPMIAAAAAWASNPAKAPLFLDSPVQNGELQATVAAKFAANQPLAMVDQYVTNIRRLHAIAFDAGDQDPQNATNIEVLDRILNGYQIPHFFEIYEGTHLNRVAERAETKMLPFFSKNLAFPADSK